MLALLGLITSRIDSCCGKLIFQVRLAKPCLVEPSMVQVCFRCLIGKALPQSSPAIRIVVEIPPLQAMDD
jgi:hypothetical protein